MSNFASASGFQPVRIKDAALGTLLLPLEPIKEAHLLAGVNDHHVIIQLNGERAFFGEPRDGQYDGETGLAVDQFEIEVDLASAYRPRAAAQNPGDVGVCTEKASAYLIMLDPDGKKQIPMMFKGQADPRMDSFVGYRVWRFVKFNDAGERTTLFTKE